MPKAEEVKAPAEGQPHRQEEVSQAPKLAPMTPWEQAHEAELFRDTDSHPATMRRRTLTPEEEKAQGQAQGQAPKRLVVLAGRLGSTPGWGRGEVIDAKALPEGEAARLLREGAVRAADEAEAAQERVTLTAAGPAPTFEAQVSEAAAERDRLKSENFRLRAELDQAKKFQGQGQQPPAVQGADPKLLAEKDRAIEQLQARVRELEAQAQQGPEEGEEGRKGKGRR